MFCCRKLYKASADRGPRMQSTPSQPERNDQVRKRPGLSSFIPFPFVAEIPTRKSMERGSRGDGRAVEVGTCGIKEDDEGGSR